MPAKRKVKPQSKESIESLKKQLEVLQERIADYTKTDNPLNYESPAPRVIEVKELYSWKAPERLFIPRNRKWYTYVILLVLILTLVLLFLQQFIIIAPILAIAFVSYVLASVQPEEIEHRLTTQGINSGNHSYLWDELGDFWFAREHTETVLHITTFLNFPRRLIFLIGAGDKEKIKDILVQYLPFREIPKTTWLDRAANWLASKFQKIAG